MFLITWMFDKLGYMPKIKIDAGVVTEWPFPAEDKDFFGIERKKPAAKKVAAKKVAAKKTATRKPKAK